MSLHDIVKKGSTNRSVTVRIIDSSDGTPETGVVYNTAGIDLWYRREGAAKTSITEATLAALTTAHADGGFLHISDGEYRLDLPDAAFATGAEYVDFGGTVTGMVVIGGRVRLVDVDLEDATRFGLSALPNAAADAAGGLPISDAGGLDLDTKLANTNEVTAARMGALTDWINGGRLDLLLDQVITDIAALNNYDGTDTSGVTTLLSRLSAARAGYLDNLNGHTAQTGDSFARIGANGAGLTDLLTATGFSTLSAADVRAAVGLASANLDTQLAAIAAYIDTEVGTIITNIGNLNDVSAADVLAQVEAALDDAIPELGVAAPSATPSLRTGMMLLYMMARNQMVVQTSGTDAIEVYNDAGTLIAKKLITDDGSDYTEAEMVSG